MVPPTVSLRQLQYIVAVADLGGFGRAAEQCHVAQPSLSAQIALAEDQLGVQIFERSRQGVRLSSVGAAVVERARRVLGAQRELEEVVNHLRDPFRGTFRLGIIPTVGPYLLPDVAPVLTRAHPDLTLVWREDRTASLVQQSTRGRSTEESSRSSPISTTLNTPLWHGTRSCSQLHEDSLSPPVTSP